MEGAEHFYHNSVRDQIKTVIDTHGDNPKIVRTYKAMHFALEDNDDALLTKPRFRDYQGMDKRCEEDFNDRINQFNRQMGNNDISGAEDTATALERMHPYDVATHIARAQVSIKNGDMVAAKNAVNNAEDYDKRERELARHVDYQLVDNGQGMKIDVQAAAINHAEELHEQVNHTKYSYLMKEYGKADSKQKPHRLDIALSHTKACVAEDDNNVRYWGNHADLLLIAGLSEQAISPLEKICSLSPQPRNYYRLADVLSNLGELSKANDFYQKGLSVPHYNYDNEKSLTYVMQCKVRENYIALEKYDEAKNIAKTIYNSPSVQPDDITSYAILCFQVGNDLMLTEQIQSANLIYEEGLAIQNYSNASMRHEVQCKVRDNYIALENFDKALQFAKEIYDSLESRPTDIYSYAILCLQNKQLESAEIALQQFVEHPDVVENSEYQQLLSDSHAKLGDILASKGDFSRSLIKYQESLISSNESHIGALLGASRILCSKGDYFTAEKHLIKLEIELQN